MSMKMSAMPCATLEFSSAVEKPMAKAMVTYTVQSRLSRACVTNHTLSLNPLS